MSVARMTSFNETLIEMLFDLIRRFTLFIGEIWWTLHVKLATRDFCRSYQCFSSSYVFHKCVNETLFSSDVYMTNVYESDSKLLFVPVATLVQILMLNKFVSWIQFSSSADRPFCCKSKSWCQLRHCFDGLRTHLEIFRVTRCWKRDQNLHTIMLKWRWTETTCPLFALLVDACIECLIF